MGKYCGICLEPADIPFTLPCSDAFCYLCIARHLRTCNFCPVCLKASFSKFDLKTSCHKMHNLSIPSAVLALKEQNMKKILKRYKILAEGSLTIVTRRYMDLLDILFREQFKKRMLSDSEIAWLVNRDSQRKRTLCRPSREILNALLALRERMKQETQSHHAKADQA